jgi:hypothetical protein
VRRWDIILPEAAPLYQEALIVEPLEETPQDWLLRDVFDPRVPLEILADMFYVMQRAKFCTFYIPTAHPDRLIDFARTVEMGQLLLRNSHIRYVAVGRLQEMAGAPVRSKEAVVAGDAELGSFLPHDFSVAPTKPGCCELCEGTLRAPLHDQVALPIFSVIRCAEPTGYLLAQCERGHVEFTEVVF